MQIILVRHAAAVDRAPDLEDRERRLTEEGEARLRADLPLLRRHLKQEGPPLIWASDALRSRQTAAIIAEALSAPPPAVHPFIYTGEFELLEEAVAALPTQSCLIVAGHEPWLSGWAERFCGLKLRFRKGGMAGFDVVQLRPLKAALSWSCRAGAPREDRAALSAPASLAPWREAMLEALKAMGRWRRALLKDPARTRPPHQLRVSARRARSLLSFLRPLLDEAACQDHQALLREVMRLLAPVRELDVLRLERRAFEAGGGPRLRELGRAIRRERGRAQASAAEGLQAEALAERLKAFREAVAAWDSLPMAQEELESFEAQRLARWQKGIWESWLRLDIEDLGQLHQLRLRLKKYNNLLAQGRFEKHERSIEGLPGLKGLQARLGEICDIHAHAQRVSALQKEAPGAALDRDAARFREHLNVLEGRLRSRLAQDLSGRPPA